MDRSIVRNLEVQVSPTVRNVQVAVSTTVERPTEHYLIMLNRTEFDRDLSYLGSLLTLCWSAA
jgi:hypothetical protein